MPLVLRDVLTARVIGGPADGVVFEIEAGQTEVVLRVPLVEFGHAASEGDFAGAIEGARYRFAGRFEDVPARERERDGSRRAIFVFDEAEAR